MALEPIKPVNRPRIGLYSIGLHANWDQFPGLRERLIGYGQHIERHLSAWGEVHNFGLVDT
jgi:L-arabinose isomerase